eukprot:gene8646-8827_t
MPHVRKIEVLAVARELWGSTGILEDEAKLVLAEQLISDVWENKKSGIPLNMAGVPIKAALGDRWLTSNERQAAGKPMLRQVLADDPYFVLKDVGGPNPNVRLRISRLSQLIGHPEMVEEYRWNKPKRAVTPVGSHFYTESHLEPGVMLLDGVHPLRPGERRCTFFVKNGYCMFKAKCRHHHPSPTELAADQGSSLPSSSAASAQDEATAPAVKQPPTQQLLGVVVDAVWPPEQGRQNAIKGALAKHILEKQLAAGDVQDESKRLELLLSQAGMFLNNWWQRLPSYDPSSKPYKVLADELAEDPLYEVSVNSKNAVVVHLLLGRLLDVGGPQAAAKLSEMADVVWPPLGGKEVWLRGRLAKWLLTAGFEGDNGRVLRQVLAVGSDASTVFRIDMAQAEIEAQLAEIASLSYEPPENMQWWWPEDKPENPNCVWAEVAIRLLDPFADDAELQLAEMVQHLEICPVLAVACATYKSHPHLLQFFAPYAAIGGLEMPAAVYLIDVLKPGPQVQQVLELVRPVLASGSNLKVCHGSKMWAGQVEKAFKIKLNNYFDTQQASFVWHSLRYEAGRLPNMNQVALKNTAEMSLSSLLRTFDFYHPEKHSDKSKDAVRIWQNRPLSEDLVTCAAADVAYLLPLMEIQVRNVKLAALEVRKQQQQQRPGTRAASLLTSLPPELADATTLATLAQTFGSRFVLPKTTPLR